MSTERTSQFLMANVGSEVTRMISARNSHDTDLLNGALERALAIIVQIKTKPEMKAREYEINTLELVLRDAGMPDPQFKISDKNLKEYFVPFTVGLLE